MYSYGSPHTAAQKQDDQHERTFSSCVRIVKTFTYYYLLQEGLFRDSKATFIWERQAVTFCSFFYCVLSLNIIARLKKYIENSLVFHCSGGILLRLLLFCFLFCKYYVKFFLLMEEELDILKYLT